MKLFVFGPGYSARAFISGNRARFETASATARMPDSVAALERDGICAHLMRDDALSDDGRAALRDATHLLISIPPDARGDPVLRIATTDIEAAPGLRWIGYLSSVAVYGDRGGGWVDEDGLRDATSLRGRQRIDAEDAWLALGSRLGVATHVFRLAGIYGPGRNALVNLRDGKAKRLVKQGQVFNRIHVEDIARIVAATIDKSHPGGAWNVADDEPSPPQDVVTFAADLLGVAPPSETPFDAAALSPMAASFYADNKRIANRRMKTALGVALRHPTYREGLRALFAAGEGR